jgi:hypothetical protein
MGTQRRCYQGVIGGQRKVFKVEAGSNGTAYQRVRPGGPCRLPVSCRDGADRALLAVERAQALSGNPLAPWGGYPQIERGALVKVPGLVRQYSVPTADRSLGQEEIDRGKRRTSTSPIGSVYPGLGTVDLAVIASLSMRDEAQRLDQLVHAVGMFH